MELQGGKYYDTKMEELLKTAKRKNQLGLLYSLFISPEYKVGSLADYKIDGSEETFCWN